MRAQWVDLVTSVSRTTYQANTAIEEAADSISGATNAGVMSPTIETIKIEISETENLVEQFQELSSYVIEPTNVDGGDSTKKIDPLGTDTEEDSTVEVRTPSDTKHEIRAYRKVRSRLLASVKSLEADTELLNQEVLGSLKDSVAVWTSARDALAKEVQAANTLAKAADDSLIDPASSAPLVEETKKAQKVLDSHKNPPQNTNALTKQTETFNTSKQSLAEQVKALQTIVEAHESTEVDLPEVTEDFIDQYEPDQWSEDVVSPDNNRERPSTSGPGPNSGTGSNGGTGTVPNPGTGNEVQPPPGPQSNG